MARRERDILEHAVRRISEQAANTNKVIDEAMEAGLAADHPVTVAAKQVRTSTHLLTLFTFPGTPTPRIGDLGRDRGPPGPRG